METNENEKKPNRPRIGQMPSSTGDSNDTNRYEKVNYNRTDDGDAAAGQSAHPHFQRPYQPRYNNNNYNGQNRQGYYNG